MAGPTATNPACWYKADSLVLSDGDPVSSWSDSTGNGLTMLQAAADNRPAYKTNIINGLPVVRFSLGGAGNDHMATANTAVNFSGDLTIFAVVPAIGNQRVIIDKDNAASGGEFSYYTDGSGKPALDRPYVEGGVAATNAIADWAILACVVSGTNVAHWMNDSANGTDTLAAGTAVNTPLRLGSFNAAANFLGSDLAEVLVYTTAYAHGSTEHGDIYDYLHARYFEAPPTYDDNPSGTVVISGSGSAPAPGPLFGYTPRVRENPPLRLHILAHTPNGNTFRWGEDERRPENNYEGLNFATTIPGGFETMDCTLPRKTRLNYQDLTRLSTLTVKGAGERVAGEYRLEKTPRSSGTGDRSIKPQAVGWQAHLDDDTEAAEVYVDRDLNNWGGSSRQRQINNYGTYEGISDPSVDPDTTTGIPALNLTLNGTGAATDLICEAIYDAGPAALVALIYYDITSQGTGAGYDCRIGTWSDDVGTATSDSAALLPTAAGTRTGTAYRFAHLSFFTGGISPTDGDHNVMARRLTVWGNHGLTKQGTAPNDGLYSSDVIANALSRWCPLIRFTTGSDGTLRPTAFIIPQLEFRSFTTTSDILTQANRFHLWDWAVWEGQRDGEPTFYYNERNGRGRRWRARVSPSNLQETGPQVDRLWNGIIVSYQDVDGTNKTVGPTGSLADATSADLLDTDPLNPVNQLGIKRYATLDMGIVSTSAGATEVGRQFLERSKELDQSGSADLVGYVTDDHGVNHPSWAVRAGDQISFVDASDSSYRRVVHTNYDHDARSNSVDLDSPPEGMDALLEELGASLYLGTPSTSDFSGGPMTITSTANVSF